MTRDLILDDGSPASAETAVLAPPDPPWRPDWTAVYRGLAHMPDRDGELVAVTRETARIALSTIDAQCREDYYHNIGAAGAELAAVLKK